MSTLFFMDEKMRPTQRRLSEEELADTWEAFVAGGRSDLRLRNLLSEHYLSDVRLQAERLASSLPLSGSLTSEDLFGYGVLGLFEAIQKFEPARGLKFATFSAWRIKGAMLDSIREADHLSRRDRSLSSQRDRLARDLSQRLGRPATDEEIAAEAPPKLFPGMNRAARFAYGPSSLDQAVNPLHVNGPNESRREELVDILRDRAGERPGRPLEKATLMAFICRGLSRAERLMLLLYYFDGCTMKEIGATLDLSESRVSQMHTAVIARLRERLRQHRDIL